MKNILIKLFSLNILLLQGCSDYSPMTEDEESEIISIFDEVKNEIEQIELRKKIESLEDKVSMNLDEKLYSELVSLRNQLKSG